MSANTNNKPATKGDLHSSINSLRTELKGDIQRLDKTTQRLDKTTQQLDKTSKQHTLEFFKIQRDMRDMKEQMATKDDISRIITAIDIFAGEAKEYRNKDTLRGHAVMTHDTMLKEHEKRISALEQNK